jgi:acetylornithine deacetylase/succinyl-diaminopimelate desuccinylase-like protein
MTLDAALAACGDQTEAGTILAELVRERSYPGEEAAVQERVASWLREQGLTPAYQRAGPNRPNIVAVIENGDGPTLLLNGHTDTVLQAGGWSSDPWEGRREGDRFYGLGACDMKSGVTAMLLAARALDRNRDGWTGRVIVSSVVDEEAYSLGAHALIDQGLQADYAIVLESAWETPCLGSIGKVLVQVDVTGRAAHATWPERGINAAIELAKFVARIEELPLPKHPRMRATHTVLSSLSGSTQYVITVPEKARALINRHTVPGETAEQVVAQYRALADSLSSPATFELSVQPPFYPPWETPLDAPIVSAMNAAMQAERGEQPAPGYWGFGDMNLFSGEAGISTVMFGPHGAGYHEADEWVDLSTIVPVARMVVRMAHELLPG